jgi:hypothetical protein
LRVGLDLGQLAWAWEKLSAMDRNSSRMLLAMHLIPINRNCPETLTHWIGKIRLLFYKAWLWHQQSLISAVSLRSNTQQYLFKAGYVFLRIAT